MGAPRGKFAHSTFEEILAPMLTSVFRHSKGIYKDPPSNTHIGTLQGGIRLLICDRPNMHPGMTISRRSFETIESAFRLPASTLPSFFLNTGACSKYTTYDPVTSVMSQLSLVVKATQKVEIANYLLSMSHDFTTGWTTAFICGDGAIKPRNCDVTYGNQLPQIVTMITSSTGLWSHPTFLPTLLLGNYCQRIEIRTRTLEKALLKLETGLGVTIAGGAGIGAIPQENWPENINVKETTIGLHSTMAKIIFMLRTCDWARRYSSFLKELDDDLTKDQSLKLDKGAGNELRERIIFVTSSLDGMRDFFSALQERAQTQINVVSILESLQVNLSAQNSD